MAAPGSQSSKTFDVEAYCAELAKSGSEHAEQRAFFGWLNWAWFTGLFPHANRMYAIPNGGERNPVVAARLKAEGVKSGVPDMHWPCACGAYHSLYIELKAKGGSASDTQTDWHNFLRQQGHAVAVCWGWRAARTCFLAYAAGAPVDEQYK